MRVVSFKVPDDLYDALRELARLEDRSASSIIRSALEAYIRQRHEKLAPYVGNHVSIYVEPRSGEAEEVELPVGQGLPPWASEAYAAILRAAGGGSTTTSEAYREFVRAANERGVRPVSYRAFSTVVNRMAELGLVDVKVVSRGRHGRVAIITPRRRPQQ